MKKLITLSICLLAITSSFANITFSKNDDKSKMEITLTLNDVKAGQKLSIKDAQGVLLFNKTIVKSGTFNNRFDISELPNGVYHFEHEKENYTKLMPFTVSYGHVTFAKANEKFVYKPLIRVKDNDIYVSKLDLEKEGIEVDIYYVGSNDKDYRLLHSENIADDVKVERIYRLSQEYKGNYKMVINADGKNYVEHFKI